MSNKLLISGLALGRDSDSSICGCCNFNLQWLEYSSTLLWADKILVTKSIWEIINNGHAVFGTESKHEEGGQAIKILFQILKDKNLIEIINPVITKDLTDIALKTIDNDIEQAKYKVPSCKLREGKEQPFALSLGKYQYCIPNLLAIYTSFIISRLYKANPLLNDSEMTFYKYKFSHTYKTTPVQKQKQQSFETILNIALPEMPIFQYPYLFDDKDVCKSCTRLPDCSDNYLSDMEKNIYTLINRKNYDEIQELINLLNKISNKLFTEDAISNPKDFQKEFFDEASKINRRVKSIFPKVKRWTNLITGASVPISLTSLFYGNPIVALSAASLGGISKLSNEVVNYFESKYNWLNYFNHKL